MEVPAAGMGASGLQRANSPPGLAPPANLPATLGRTAPVAADSVAAFLGELSQSDLTRLLEIVDLPRPGNDAQAGELLRAAVEAVAARNNGRALDLLRQLAAVDPARAETTVESPDLATIRPNLEQMLSQLTAATKLRAEGRLTDASRKFETATFKQTLPNGPTPEIFLSVAGRFLEAGGLANYVRSAALSDALIDQSRWAPAPGSEPAMVNRSLVERRVTLRFLISTWLTLGIASAGLCWWVRDDYLPSVCVAWAVGLVVLIFTAARLRLPRS